ncbi:inositol monophosphatase [Aureimonas fodinaquatilis]|uniref:Inositol monophosphatase n=2 Tax=Aureimonas fodinaquatilis TaxID=2565783 RepID=A0A5B0DY32_9HYPH|nr:inositol monophosphatase [Aureimonas fodinaquatilis]
MPRFRRLAAGDIREKTSAVDLVTEADERAELLISRECASAFPQAVFIGEEGVSATPELIEKVAECDLAIVVDPIDGTANFAAGSPVFGVMAAVVRRGELVGGIIYDPMGDDFIMAERGAGTYVWQTGGASVRQHYASPVPVAEMVGAASTSQFSLTERRKLLAGFAETRILCSYRAAAQEYRLAASGALHYLFYWRLMPWDHLAGALMVEESGGYVRRLDGSRYLPTHISGGVLCAPDAQSWQELRNCLPI